MRAQLARLPVISAESRSERRRVSRIPAEVNALMLSSHGERACVKLADVSSHGCSVTGHVGWLRAGSFVSIGFSEGTGLRAIVRWLRDDAAGMEFLQPVPRERTEWHALIDSPFGL